MTDDLPRLDLAAFLDRNVGETTRIFGRNIHLRRFKAAISLEDALRHLMATQTVEQVPGFLPERFRLSGGR
jgi:hypothetical protein